MMNPHRQLAEEMEKDVTALYKIRLRYMKYSVLDDNIMMAAYILRFKIRDAWEAYRLSRRSQDEAK